jgi:hypothetical protein
MKTPATETPLAQQRWIPGHWLTLSGFALTPSDLRCGTSKCCEAREMIRATLDTDLIIRRMLKS